MVVLAAGYRLFAYAREEAIVARKSRGPSRIPWMVIAVFLIALFVAVAAMWLGASNSTSRASDLWYEVTKAGLQLFAIALLGGAVAWAFKILDERREDRHRRDEYLATVADQLWDTYLGVKSVRRALRAAGFGPLGSGRTVSAPLTEERVKDFQEQMDLLSDAQTTLEKLKAGIKTQPPLYYPVSSDVLANVTAAETYVSDVMEVWEKHSEEIEVGAYLSNVAGFANLQLFLDHARIPGGLKEKMSYPVDDAALLIQSLRFERPTAVKKTATRINAARTVKPPGV
jgi:hypothetical protein